MNIAKDLVIRSLGVDDAALIASVSAGVFDHPVQPGLVHEFLADPRHHIVVALDAGEVVGFASGVHYMHPDKGAELFSNEVGVVPAHQRRGIAAKLMHALLEEGRALGCAEAWVATEPDSDAARALCASTGGKQDPTPFVVYSFALKPPS